jgi:hypothetical protein
LKLNNKGVAPLEAFEQSFSVSLEEIQKQLANYNRKRTLYAQRFAKPAVILDYQSKKLAQGKLYANMSHSVSSTLPITVPMAVQVEIEMNMTMPMISATTTADSIY